MSIKKVISLSFLLLANIAILAHNVVCHHHNGQQSAISCTENQTHHCDENAEYNCPCTDDTHKCCVIENCLLSNSITKAGDFKLTKTVGNSFYIVANNTSACQTLQVTDLLFRQKPYLSTFHSTFLSQSLGLRAPPFC